MVPASAVLELLGGLALMVSTSILKLRSTSLFLFSPGLCHPFVFGMFVKNYS